MSDRWPGDPSLDAGIDVRCLELDSGNCGFADILRRSDVVAQRAMGLPRRPRATPMSVSAGFALAIVYVDSATLTGCAWRISPCEWRCGLWPNNMDWPYNRYHRSSCMHVAPTSTKRHPISPHSCTACNSTFGSWSSRARHSVDLSGCSTPPPSVCSHRHCGTPPGATQMASEMCNDPTCGEELVTTVASQLMTVDAATSAGSVSAFWLSSGTAGRRCRLLRHNDRDRRATGGRMATSPPYRTPIAQAVRHDADPVFALCEHAKSLVFRPGRPRDRRASKKPQGFPARSATAVPHLARSPLNCWGSISSVIGSNEPKLNALATIATLFAWGTGSRRRRDRLRYLADR